MSETPTTLEAAIEQMLRRIVREEIGALKADVNGQDHLLDAETTAKFLSVSEDWLYRNARKLPFTRKLGPKMLRFSSVGIQKYLGTRRVFP
jgi:predicted DNA-binding transcriptional regulator AlpA